MEQTGINKHKRSYKTSYKLILVGDGDKVFRLYLLF